MQEDARNSMYEPEIIDVSPSAETTKPNYITATIWTTIVAVLVCGVFSGFLLYLYNESNVEETLSRAVSQAVMGLSRPSNSKAKRYLL